MKKRLNYKIYNYSITAIPELSFKGTLKTEIHTKMYTALITTLYTYSQAFTLCWVKSFLLPAVSKATQ